MNAVFTRVLGHIPFGPVFVLKRLGQFEIIESSRIAKRDQDRAAILRRMGTVSSQRLDIPFRAHRIGDALVYQITVKDVRRFCCSLVQVSCNLAPRLHSQYDHCWT